MAEPITMISVKRNLSYIHRLHSQRKLDDLLFDKGCVICRENMHETIAYGEYHVDFDYMQAKREYCERFLALAYAVDGGDEPFHCRNIEIIIISF